MDQMLSLDILRVGAEYMRDGRFKVAHGSSVNAYSSVWAKAPSELSRQDAIVCGAVYVPHPPIW